MKETDYSKYDEVSKRDLQFIHAKEAIENLEKAVEEFKQSHTALERLGGLEERIKVLEEARVRQIALNSTFAQVSPMEKKEVKSFWPWKR